jgi:cytochrome c5
MVWTGVAAAGGPNPNRGKSLFKSACKTCHVKGGGAKDFSPMTKTQAQWKRAFEKDVDKCVKAMAAKPGATALTAKDLDDMKFYLVSHAADSDQPETCGIK